jgi:general stress protein 26
VKALPNGDGEDLWTRWFLTLRAGRKSAEIRAAGRVTLAYQHDSGDAYVTIAGRAEIIDEPSAVEAACSRGMTLAACCRTSWSRSNAQRTILNCTSAA